MQVRKALTVLTGGVFDGTGNRVYSPTNPAPMRPYAAPTTQYQPPSHQVTSSAGTMTGGTVQFVPFDVGPGGDQFDRIAVNVGTAVVGGTTPTLRLGIYADDGTGGGPGTLVLDAGNVVITATGIQTITISQTLAAGRYWLAGAYTFAATPTTAPQVFMVTSSLSISGPTWTNAYRSKSLSIAAGAALPASGAGAAASTSGAISIALRAT